MVKVGILGAGFMGEMHSNVYANLADSAKLVSVCDIDKSKAGKIAVPRAAETFDLAGFDGFLNSGIDVVDICLPTYSHVEYTVKAARAGKHVLCEKPMALNLKEADEMLNAVKKAKVKFMVAHCIRFWPEYLVLKEFVEKKQFGKLRSLFLSRLSPTPIWSWNNWLATSKRSGGAALDLHIHDTDFVVFLLGMPESVYSVGTIDKNGLSHIYTDYNFKNYAVVAEGGWNMPDKFPFNMSYLAVFEEGVLSFSLHQNPTLLCYIQGKETYTPEIQVQELAAVSSETKGNISSLGGYYNEIKYFIECIEKNMAPKIVTGFDARESLRVILSEFKSVETGKIIKL